MQLIGLIRMADVCSKCEESEHLDIFRSVGARVLKTYVCREK